MGFLFLFAAIVSELIGAIATRFSDGFTKFIPSAIAVIGVLGAYILLSQSLTRGVGIGMAYAIWAGVGVMLVAIIGAVFLGDALSRFQWGGIILIIAGVLAMELGGASEQSP